MDLLIPACQTLALVGPTGAGKSTLAKLITRTYDPNAGSVSLDGRDVREVTLTSLRKQLGVVPQEPFLFCETLRDNLTLGRPDATDDEVVQTCRATGLDLDGWEPAALAQARAARNYRGWRGRAVRRTVSRS